MLVPFILMGAYAYYQLALPLFPDELYDEWCRRIVRCRRRITHFHRHLIDYEGVGLNAGVLLNEWQYPERIKGATNDWIIRWAYPELNPNPAERAQRRRADADTCRRHKRFGITT